MSELESTEYTAEDNAQRIQADQTHYEIIAYNKSDHGVLPIFNRKEVTADEARLEEATAMGSKVETMVSRGEVKDATEATIKISLAEAIDSSWLADNYDRYSECIQRIADTGAMAKEDVEAMGKDMILKKIGELTESKDIPMLKLSLAKMRGPLVDTGILSVEEYESATRPAEEKVTSYETEQKEALEKSRATLSNNQSDSRFNDNYNEVLKTGQNVIDFFK